MAEPELAYKYPYTGYEDGALEGESLYRCRPGYAAYTSYALNGGEEKPAKKVKMGNASGGIISRFLNSATGRAF